MPDQKKLNDISLISLYAGLTAALYFLSEYNFPGISVVMRILCPVPFIYLAIKTNFQNALKGALVVFAFLFLINLKEGISYFLKFAPLTLASAYFFKSPHKDKMKIVYIVSAGVTGAFLYLLAMAAFFEINFFAIAGEQFNAGFEESFKILSAVQRDEALISNLRLMQRVFIMIIPGIFIVSEALFTLIFLYSAVYIFKKARVRLNFSMPVFRLWNFGLFYLWPLILAMLLTYLFRSYKMAAAAGMNMLFVFAAVYVLQGLAVFVYFLNKWRYPVFVKVLFFLVLFLISGSALFFLVLTGVIDAKFDLRKIETASEKESEKKEKEQ